MQFAALERLQSAKTQKLVKKVTSCLTRAWSCFTIIWELTVETINQFARIILMSIKKCGKFNYLDMLQLGICAVAHHGQQHGLR